MNLNQTMLHHFPEYCAVSRFHTFVINYWTQVAGLTAGSAAI
jgi:hypothetical protein